MRLARLVAVLGLSLALAACPPNGPPPPEQAQLLRCPNDQEVPATATIGPEGGTLQVGNHRLEVPAGAVAQPVTFSGALLADSLLKLDLRADGAESYAFQQRASLTLGFAQCEAPAEPQRIRVYKLDPRTNRILRELDGQVNPDTREVTASLDSLSTYTAGIPD